MEGQDRNCMSVERRIPTLVDDTVELFWSRTWKICFFFHGWIK